LKNLFCGKDFFIYNTLLSIIYIIAGLVGTSFPSAFIPSSTQIGFAKSGIWSLHPDVFTNKDFWFSYVSERPSMWSDYIANENDEPQGLQKYACPKVRITGSTSSVQPSSSLSLESR